MIIDPYLVGLPAGRLRGTPLPDGGVLFAGIPFAAPPTGSVDGLLDAPAEKILAAQPAVVDADIGRRNLPGGRSWGVVLDGAVLPRHPLQAVSDGAAAGTGLLVGANREEVRLFQVMQGATFTPADEGALPMRCAAQCGRPNGCWPAIGGAGRQRIWPRCARCS